MKYDTRSAAKNAARSLGWDWFRTVQTSNGSWSAQQVFTSPPDFSWSIGKDFVAWREIEMHANGNTYPVLVISCTIEELDDENVPSHYLIEPQTPSLFAPDATVGESRRARAPSASTGERARSTIESPTKLVWSTADELIAINPAADRKAIIAACVEKGIHPSTASTQFSKWRKARS